MNLFDAFGDRWTVGREVCAADNVDEGILGGHHVPRVPEEKSSRLMKVYWTRRSLSSSKMGTPSS